MTSGLPVAAIRPEAPDPSGIAIAVLSSSSTPTLPLSRSSRPSSDSRRNEVPSPQTASRTTGRTRSTSSSRPLAALAASLTAWSFRRRSSACSAVALARRSSSFNRMRLRAIAA